MSNLHYNRILLKLSGEVLSGNEKFGIDYSIVSSLANQIKKIHNQIRIGEAIGAGTQANDLWLASKVRTKIVADERVPALQVKVVVQDSEVFLMGRLTNLEATAAVDIARNITGVARVVRAFEIVQ